jgi:RadC-like JAB domain
VIQHAGAAEILFHNHPSGVSEPNPADEGVTRRIRSARALIDLRVPEDRNLAATAAVLRTAPGAERDARRPRSYEMPRRNRCS